MVARYQQFFGIRALLACINERKPDGSREGGVVAYHGLGQELHYGVPHQGAGAARIDADPPRVVVTDRLDLEDQLARNFMNSGCFRFGDCGRRRKEKAKVARRESGASARAPSASSSTRSTSSPRLPNCPSKANAERPDRAGGRRAPQPRRRDA